ncbi:putative ribosome recycling factor, RRF superfamily [Helianthus annuus]|nr:putative ribosome recycling factor, RRF superfamily [Helianthus annuus]
MAISIKRAIISCRNIHPLLRASRRCSHFAAATSSLRTATDPHPYRSSYPEIGFLHESRRSFAKSRKKWDDDGELGVANADAGSRTEIVNMGPIIKQTAISEMEAAIDAVSHELSKLRTGRASAGMLDHIIVETDGVKMPLNRMAVVSVLDPKTLSVTPYNPNALKELEKAIVSSPLGLNPKPDGERLITAIPPMTKEHMQAVCKVVSKSAEDVKQRIRRARQKALDTIKKSVPKKSEGKDKDKNKAKAVSGFSADDAKRLEKEVEELTKKYSKSAEELCKAKEKEITSS